MALELQQQLRLTQQLIMTPQLQMAIKLLQLSRLELMEMIFQEMEENPTIDEVADISTGEADDERPDVSSEDIKEVTVEDNLQHEIDWNNYIDEYSSSGNISYEPEEKDTPQYETFVTKRKSLDEHILWQLLMTFPSSEEEAIGSIIVGNIDSNGFLTVTHEEISEMSGYPIETVDNVLTLMQTFDPIGVCARNLEECLLIQAKSLGLNNSIVTDIITNHLTHLQNKNYNAICRALKKDLKDVILAADVIRSLEPRPCHQFNNDESQYISPDIFVYKEGDEFVIVQNDDGMPRLKVSPFYRDALRQDSQVSGNAKNYIQEKLRSATWLIKSIHQRQRTIYKVMESIVRFQREFFEKGIAYLKPMVLRDVAEDIDMHESTISRVTTNKYVHTPQGIFELKYFFNSSIKRVYGEAIASATVKERIRQIIQNEDKRKPFSDDKIAQILKQSNIEIARRTVAKYREMLGVLPSSKRKQL
jgi:RNA polymerase sigma-54 factor